MEWVGLLQLLQLKTLMVEHGGSSAGSYLADPTSPPTVLQLPCLKVSQCINCHD